MKMVVRRLQWEADIRDVAGWETRFLSGEMCEEVDRRAARSHPFFMSKPLPWPAVQDATVVERPIPSLQQAIVATAPATSLPDVAAGIAAPDVANALLFVLASVLDASSMCAPPQGKRKLAEAVGHELHQLMRDTRRIREANVRSLLSVH